jgi:hypothetical protein
MGEYFKDYFTQIFADGKTQRGAKKKRVLLFMIFVEG